MGAANNNILASAIADTPHLVAFDLMAQKRFSGFQLDRLLTYIIDTVDASALPFLAEQFDVLGYKGMRLATTELEQRAVIKNAIKIKRHAGTPWAVKEALRAIGYPDAVLIENAGTGDRGWAQFRINLDTGDKPISGDLINELIENINIYKNKRSHLIDLSYTINFIDDVITITELSDESPSVDDTDTMIMGGDFKHNGQFLRNGTKNYSRDSDLLDIQIIDV
jgi:P2-related tail formation protein